MKKGFITNIEKYKHMSLAAIARENGIPEGALRSRVRRHKETPIEDMLYKFGRKTSNKFSETDLDKYNDPDQELKNKIKSYKSLGMTDEEILIKARIGGFLT